MISFLTICIKKFYNNPLEDIKIFIVEFKESDEEIILYDATGTALQDVAAAVHIYKKSLIKGVGTIW